MKNYLCTKCATLIQRDSTPSSSSCPKSGTHSWQYLGEVGDKSYQCKKCATVVKATAIPLSSTCPNGGTHSWSVL